MITYEEALKAILAEFAPLDIFPHKLEKLNNYYLAHSVTATFDMPRFNNSAVDGFGVLVSDIKEASVDNPIKLSLSGTISAGAAGDISIVEGSTVKILTGAPVPEAIEAVVMKEYCQEQNGNVSISCPAQLGENIRYAGDEYRKGQSILPKGKRITPPVIGLLATLGHDEFPVYRKPRLSILATGDELVKPGTPLGAGQIYDSNSYALTAAAQFLGIDECTVYNTGDTFQSTKDALELCLSQSDVVISSGGVSVGDYDYVKDAAEALGVQGVLWKIAIKPGKPVYFGKLSKGTSTKFIFGLPGNPVSSLVTFNQFVKPALLKMIGAQTVEHTIFSAELTKTIKKKAGRMEFVRGVIESNNDKFLATPASGQDSHMLGGLCQANCLIHFPKDTEILTAGTTVQVEWLDWNQ